MQITASVAISQSPCPVTIKLVLSITVLCPTRHQEQLGHFFDEAVGNSV